MKKVYISDAGPKVSQAIYGFWRWTNEPIAQLEQTIKLCLELGINTFDHADHYGEFTIEERFGSLIKNKALNRSDLILFSKCGLRGRYFDNSPEHIQSSIEQSLKKLGTDYLDIFLLDQFDHTADPEVTAVTLDKLVSSGKTKNIGVSNFSVFQHQLLASYMKTPIVTNHIELNLMNISALQDGRLDFIKQSFSKPLVWAPLAGGEILDGKDVKGAILNAKLGEIAQKYQANVEQIAVAWLLQIGTLPIIGSLSTERIKNVATATEIALSKEDWYEILSLCQSI